MSNGNGNTNGFRVVCTQCDADCRLYISSNAKTGMSLNVGLETCQPTKWCLAHCYARRRTRAEGCRLGSTSNVAPITGPVQQACYANNSAVLRCAGDGGSLLLGRAAGRALLQRGLHDLRLFATGDLFYEAACFALGLSSVGVLPWGFSRKPDQLFIMADLYGRALSTQEVVLPHMLGSVDRTTPPDRIDALVAATRAVNGVPALAYAADSPDDPVLIAQPHWMRHVKVVFGYHAGRHCTVLNHPLECPATAGRDIHCADCRRCKGVDNVVLD